MPTEAIQTKRKLLGEGFQAFDYDFRRKSSREDLHEDEEVILDPEIATDKQYHMFIYLTYIFIHSYDKGIKN